MPVAEGASVGSTPHRLVRPLLAALRPFGSTSSAFGLSESLLTMLAVGRGAATGGYVSECRGRDHARR